LSIQPGSSKDEQLITVARALHVVAQCSHQRATLMLEQRATSSVHRFERGDLGIPSAELGTEMSPQARGDDPLGVKQLSTEANEADV
jgi:hypothetical protein